MAHFKLKSVDVDEMFCNGISSGTYEYICVRNRGEKSYTRLSGPMGGFDVFNLRCQKREDYKRAEWIINQLNKKYKDNDFTSREALEKDIVDLFGSYKRVKEISRDLKYSGVNQEPSL